MDKKYKDPALLHSRLSDSFLNGQFQLMLCQDEIWRGQIKDISVESDGKKYTFRIVFEWYVRVRKMFIGPHDTLMMVGEAQTSVFMPTLATTFQITNFYHPHNRFFARGIGGDPRRIKGLTADKKEFRFFRSDDPTNLHYDSEGVLRSECSIDSERFSRGIPEPLGPP